MTEGRGYPKAVKAQERKDKNLHAHKKVKTEVQCKVKSKIEA